MTDHTYSTPYGSREIYRNGEPFALIAHHPESILPGPNYDPIGLSEFGRAAAAAADLLKALEALSDVFEKTAVAYRGPCWTYGASELMAARAAIAKARGEG